MNNFRYVYDVDEYLKFNNKVAPAADRFLNITQWLRSNVGLDNFYLGWLEGWQFGYWALALNDESDWIAFKLAFAKLESL